MERASTASALTLLRLKLVENILVDVERLKVVVVENVVVVG